MIMLHLVKALSNSLNGIKLTWIQEKAFRLEIILGALILPFIIMLESKNTDKLFVIFSLGLLLMTELINTAIEKTNDAS